MPYNRNGSWGSLVLYYNYGCIRRVQTKLIEYVGILHSVELIIYISYWNTALGPMFVSILIYTKVLHRILILWYDILKCFRIFVSIGY